MKPHALPLLIGLLVSTPALAQSDAASQVSAISVAPSVELASVALEAIPAGSHLVVKALRPVGELVEISVEAAATGASFVLSVTADTVRALGLAAGTVLTFTAVSAGYVISVGAEVLAFVPDAVSRTLIHHRELQP
jgi:hypothetical protein